MSKFVKLNDAAHTLGMELAEDEGIALKYFLSRLIVEQARRTASGITKNDKLTKRLELIRETKKEIDKEQKRSQKWKHQNVYKELKNAKSNRSSDS